MIRAGILGELVGNIENKDFGPLLLHSSSFGCPCVDRYGCIGGKNTSAHANMSMKKVDYIGMKI